MCEWTLTLQDIKELRDIGETQYTFFKDIYVRVCVWMGERVGVSLRGQPHQIHKGQNEVEIQPWLTLRSVHRVLAWA